MEVERLLAQDQPGLFAAIGELDWYSESHRHWIDDLELRSGDHVLEVGCATGALTVYVAERGHRVTGLDRSGDMIDRARSDHPDLAFSLGDATSLRFDDDTFDSVVAASVVNVVPDATAVLSEMYRVCAPGGTVSVLVPSSHFTDDDHDTVIETHGIAGFSRSAFTKWHRSAPKMSTTDLGTLFRSVGLEPSATRSYLEGMLVAVTATTRSE